MEGNTCINCEYLTYSCPDGRETEKWVCFPPIYPKIMIDDYVSGKSYIAKERRVCKELNHDGNCKYFSEKQSIFQHLLKFLCIRQ